MEIPFPKVSGIDAFHFQTDLCTLLAGEAWGGGRGVEL